MNGEIGRHSLTKAAERHAESRAAAAGDEASKAVTTELLIKKQKDPQIGSGRRRGICCSIVFSCQKFADTKWAIAGAAIATDLIAPAGLGPAMPFRNLDCFAKAVSKRGAGFRDPDRRALTQGSHRWVAGMEWDLMRSSCWLLTTGGC